MQMLSGQSLRAVIVSSVMRDPAFLAALREDAAAAVEARFGKQPYAVRVVFEAPHELAMLVPFRTDQLTRVVDRVAVDLRNRPPATKGELEALVADRAWSDPAFLAQARDDPRGTINAVLEAHGVEVCVPPGTTVRLYEEEPGECLVVIPRAIEAPAARAAAGPVAAEESGSPTVLAPFRSLTTPSVLTGTKEK